MLRKRINALLVVAFAFQAAAQTPQRLTLQDAEAMAVKNHPQIQAAQDEVQFANQQVIINRAPYYPSVTGEITGSQSSSDTARIGAGALSPSRLFSRTGEGVILSQLITDSGRTSSLIQSARLGAQASTQTLDATRYDVLLTVNRSYFETLRSEALIKVAEQTVAARQTLDDQVTELARNQLKSQLDVSFADVTVSQAKLLLINAQQAVQQAFAELARSLGTDQVANYQLVDEPLPTGPPQTPDTLVTQAENSRPELAALRLAQQSAEKFYEAERDLSRPTVSAVAVGGAIPYINTPANAPIPTGYEGIGVNASIPVFNGHLFSARREAAHQRALEADQKLRDEQERIARDVRVAWSGAVTAFQRIDVTAQFLRQAALALDLAQGRFNLGLSSIVELTQAQLNLTQAEIDNVNAKYDYQNQFAALQYTLGALR